MLSFNSSKKGEHIMITSGSQVLVWLTNPLTNSLLERFTFLLLALFGWAALVLLLFQRLRGSFNGNSSLTHTRFTPQQVLWQRYWTWAMIAFLFSGLALSGPLAIAVLCAFLCWQGGREYAQLTDMPAWSCTTLVLGGWITYAAVLLYGTNALVFAPTISFFFYSIVTLLPMKQNDTELAKRFAVSTSGLWGYLYLGWLPAHLLTLSMGKMPGLVLVVGLGVALSDVGAFCIGKALAGPKLAPHLSPGKTWSGVLGNILGAILALELAAFALPDVQLWQRGLLALVIGLGSIWGDLLESLLKRRHGVKDAGKLLPGFGGLLDRIDSLLLVTPLVYYLSYHLF
jgi:phosphatidate cytidylyltransferase